MRGQDPGGLNTTRRSTVLGAVAAALVVISFGALSQDGASPKIVPRLTGDEPPMADHRIPPLDRPVVDDIRRMRNYPEQPPIIPHAIDGYQLTINTNRCLDCHKREFTEGSGAPMISVTHFQDRDGQVLSDVTPRRYFCTACHVQQTDARPLVPNTFQDANAFGRKR
ncbi:nitrate reductase cytochrome c-type subunit [Chelatococcus reniformis]|uniref:Periplasmic nitrate reductase, electron transfer subunit n=1 Tax=Chelatococcus reniformis TaxID=1494448 RepID=A0A916TWY7_9HYPH|nr:nitrate reductase cytochrome c-type subunit [Chelatococcus reniformis]GGC48969.1 periplasmic nitrate reductase, electron transfer subunit [Chelatococcus reniformis]